MEFTLAQITALIKGNLIGNSEAKVNTLCKIENGIEGGICFIGNSQYLPYLENTKATAIIVNADMTLPDTLKTNIIKVKDAKIAFLDLLDFYHKTQHQKIGISSLSCIDSSAQIGKNVYIAEFVSIGAHAIIEDGVQLYPHVCVGDGVHIGQNTVLYYGVKVYYECSIGQNCILHAGVVIGADGFGFVPEGEIQRKVPQIGNVEIKDYVEIGANSCIDRSTMGTTIINNYVKLDNLVQIAHNCDIGQATVIAALSGISGSCKIGRQCVIGGQVGLKDHVEVGHHVMVGAQSGITKNIKDESVVLGSPAIDIRKEKLLLVYRHKLPDLYQRVEAIEKELFKD